MHEKLISEPLRPLLGEVDARSLSPGAPVLPAGFLWRKQEFRVEEVLERWIQTGPCRHGSGERYVRKHWWRLRVHTQAHSGSGEVWKVYFERQARSVKQLRVRWWLFSVAGEKAVLGDE